MASYIMGPEVAELEARLAAFCGAKHASACANGTDALALGLMAKGVRAGEAVLVPTFTFAATAEVVAWFGATPVFVDVDPETASTSTRRASRPASHARKRVGAGSRGR